MSSPFAELFGSVDLQSKSGSVPVSSLGEKTAVLLYFSAHWCPPCRGFMPVLAEFYKKHAANKNFEIVFVSSDKDQASFDEYYGEHPWAALPFSERDTKAQLSKKFKVSGIPTLVVLDSNANLITANGRAKVQEDEECEEFPWAPETFDKIMAGDLKNNKGDVVSYASLSSNTAIGFYFSAHWCPPCRGFTPKLVETYNKMKAAGKPFEIVFASSDQSEEEYNEYFAEMPWLAIPFDDKKRVAKLSDKYNVEGIPTFVIVEPATGKVINANGRGAVSSDPEGQNFPWTPKALEAIDLASDELNESACLLYLSDDISSEQKEQLEVVASEYDSSWRAAGKSRDEFPLLFFYGPASDGLGEKVLNFANIEKKPVLMILNIPEGKKYVSSETTNFVSFVSNFLSGSLTALGLKEEVN